MTIKVKIFGDLIKKIQPKRESIAIPITIEMDSEQVKTISDILNTLSIDESETSHLFVNSTYSGFKKSVKDGDRVGIFPIRMSLLYKWYFQREEDA